MKLRDMRGLRYPEEYIIRFFFKEGLDKVTGNVIEFGCSNGNNLMLFNQFGWNTTGIDVNGESISYAEDNFAKFAENRNYLFVQHDISKGVKGVLDKKFDAVLFPSVLYYISRDSVLNLLEEVRLIIKDNYLVYLRMRSVKDYRYGRGEKVSSNGFVLDIKETGEYGLLNVFYHEYELVDMLREKLGLDVSSMQIFQVDYGNVQNGVPVANSDYVIWGRTGV